MNREWTSRGGWGGSYDDSMPVATPIPADPAQLDAIVFDDRGLVPAIVQDDETHQVLMLAWMNADALARTLATGRMWYWSRSRGELWCKGETSGDRQYLKSAFFDCDADALLFRVHQEGQGACHTGQATCFFRSFGAAAN